MEQFTERANQVFAGISGDSLGDTLKLPNQWININESVDKDKGNHNEGKAYAKESVGFKKSKMSELRCKPDHILNPDKWTRYDLSDVKLSSDSVNAQSALSFLNDLKKRKHPSDSDISSNKDDSHHITFTKPSMDEHGETDGSHSTSASFAVIMPEYTIGSKKKKAKVTKKTSLGTRNSSTSNMLKLSHLDDNIDEL